MPDAVRTLETFGFIRRQLNLVAIKLLKKHRLHPKQLVLLRFVHEHKKVTLTQLAQGTATDMAAASRAVGPLINQGWLKKIRDPKDSRCWIIQLTPRAERKISELEKLYSRLADVFFDGLSARDRGHLERLLDKISAHLTKTHLEL